MRPPFYKGEKMKLLYAALSLWLVVMTAYVWLFKAPEIGET